MNKLSKWRTLAQEGAVVKFQIHRHGNKKLYAPGSLEWRPSSPGSYLVKISCGHSCDFQITKFPFTTMTAMEESLVEMQDM